MARSVRDAGGRALIVGGWVRDRLMGRTSKDVDLEVYGVPAPRLRELLAAFGSVNTVGESFTVYKVAGIDVALPRRESKTGPGHRGFEVTGDPDLPFEEAARRRDFTINAVAWDPLTGEYLDPFDGRRDLEARVLRAVDPLTFGDDSLRVLRAVQFAARFELSVEPGTIEICRRLPLDDLPPERVWGEIEKLLLHAARPSRGWALALELGIIDRLFPELQALVGCPQEPEWHPEGDVWVHTLMVVDQARTRIDDLERPQQITVMLGAVCHDLGKPPTTAFVDGRIRSIDHEQAGVAPATRCPRSPQHPDHRRLRRPPAGPRHRRAPLEAGDVQAVADAGERRRLPAPGAEGGPRAARARGEIRLSRPRPAGSTVPRWTGSSSARASWGFSTRRRSRSSRAGICSRSGSRPGPALARCSGRSTRSSSMARSRRSTRASRSQPSSSASRRLAPAARAVIMSVAYGGSGKRPTLAEADAAIRGFTDSVDAR